MSPSRRIHLSPFFSIPFTTIVYALSGAVVGATILDPHLVSIGSDCRIGAHLVICARVKIGDGASVGIRAEGLSPGQV